MYTNKKSLSTFSTFVSTRLLIQISVPWPSLFGEPKLARFQPHVQFDPATTHARMNIAQVHISWVLWDVLRSATLCTYHTK